MKRTPIVLAVLGLALPLSALAAPADFTAPGPYPVGMTKLHLTKRSVTTGEPRVLDTLVWYPAVAGSGTASPDVLLDADVLAGRWPLIMFSHGSCGTPGQSPFFTAGLASWGFIVAAPPHPGNTTAEIPACFGAASTADSFANRVPDIEFVIDELLGASAASEADSPFSHRIDPTRIGMSGHSFGGQTTLRVAAADPRVKAAVALAPASQGIAGLRIAAPTMILVGERDSLTPFATAARGGFRLLRGPRFLVEFADTGHCAFTVVCAPEFCGDGCEPDALPLDQAHDLTLRYAVPFFLRYLRGEAELARELLPAAAPEGATVVEAQPNASSVAARQRLRVFDAP